MRGVNRLDASVATMFVLAALVEAVVRDHATAGRLAFDAGGALWLATLAVRRRRPLVPAVTIAVAGLVGTTVTTLLWPAAADGGGVWILAMMLASYSLGAHQAGRSAVLGVVLPIVVVTAADATTRSGWDRVSGMLFVSVFVGLVPTALGRLVRTRHARLESLLQQHERIVEDQRAQQHAAVLAERLRTAERVQPTLVEGLQAIAASAEAAGDPGEIESAARALLSRTRDEVVDLTAPVAEGPAPEIPPVDHVRILRDAAQAWSVLAAGAVIAGLSVESTRVLEPTAAAWLLVPAAVLVGLPLALVWWRPLLAVVAAWSAATVYARAVCPLDGSLSEVAFTFVAVFGVAVLSRRWAAVGGLAACWVGQLAVSTEDFLGRAAVALACWAGGLVVNEVSRLVEQSRENNLLLERRRTAAAARAVVEERLRWAREIHDAVGHTLTVVALQAGAARRLATADPGRAEEVMRTVATAARSGVASLVHDDGRDDITRLVERVRSTGLTVDADIATDDLGPAERAIAFSVVQEGLTNVLRHAPGARSSVTVRRTEEGVEVSVSNSPPVSVGAGPGTGRGITGIRERVHAVAGRVVAEPRADGGFEVRALLPSSRVPAAVS